MSALAHAFAVAGLLALAPASAASQAPGSLVGRVFDHISGALLEDVAVTLRVSGARTATDRDGRFTFDAVGAGEVEVRLERDGYVSLVELVEIAPEEVSLVQFRLHPVSALLDELRVVAGRDPVAPPGHVEGQIVDRDDGARTAADLLLRRVPGITVTRASGAMGAGLSIRLRGASSISLSDRPTIYLDGVRIDEGGGMDIGVLDQIPAADVRRIRVLRGPAAVSRYPLAAAGVILIETRSSPGG